MAKRGPAGPPEARGPKHMPFVPFGESGTGCVRQLVGRSVTLSSAGRDKTASGYWCVYELVFWFTAILINITH